MTALDCAIAAAALWRVSAMLSYERGPLDVFVRLRSAAGIEPDEEGAPNAWPHTWRALVLVCVWCLSVNLALVYTLLWLIAPGAAFWLSMPFALSAGAICIERWTHGTS